MSKALVCWRCGSALVGLSLPLSRFDTCKACGSALHVCKQCRFFDLTVAKQCHEPVAEDVRDKQQANTCDYFSPVDDAFRPVQSPSREVSSELAALFGESAAVKDQGMDELGKQIKRKADADAEARIALEALFRPKQ